MMSFRAAIYKDIRLFLTLSGILSLLLPLVIAAGLALGLNDAQSADTVVQKFNIAVYDLDDTLMSRSLVSQLRNVELISNVKYYTKKNFEKEKAGFIDGTAALRIESGLFNLQPFKDCAAIMVVPHDFFYDAYTGEEQLVSVILNGDMPLESAIAASMASSVSGILKSERAAWYAAYSVKAGGEFDEEDFARFCEDSAKSILDNALGRLTVFENQDIRAELKGNVKNSFFACAASMLMLFVSVGVLKTLPEERKLGLYDRFFSLGGSFTQLVLSKFITAAVFCTIGIVPLMLVLKPDLMGGMLLLPTVFTACFSVMLALNALTRSAESFMLTGGILTAFSLLFGGVIYPMKLFPDAAKHISILALPKYLLLGLEKPEFSASIIPLLAISTVCMAVFIVKQTTSRRKMVKTLMGNAE